MLQFLLSMLFLIFARPFLTAGGIQSALLNISLIIVINLGLVYACQKLKTRVIGLSLSGLAIITAVLNIINKGNDSIAIIHLVLNLILLSYTAIVISYNMLMSDRISRELIFGSIAVYLLPGIIGSLVFMTVQIFDPGAFNIDINSSASSKLIYFSFVTLTTLGFGDITPQDTLAENCTIILSLIGQIYLTVVLALIVGKYVASKRP